MFPAVDVRLPIVGDVYAITHPTDHDEKNATLTRSRGLAGTILLSAERAFQMSSADHTLSLSTVLVCCSTSEHHEISEQR